MSVLHQTVCFLCTRDPCKAWNGSLFDKINKTRQNDLGQDQVSGQNLGKSLQNICGISAKRFQQCRTAGACGMGVQSVIAVCDAVEQRGVKGARPAAQECVAGFGSKTSNVPKN